MSLPHSLLNCCCSILLLYSIPLCCLLCCAATPTTTYLFPLYNSILSFCLYPFCLMELLLQEVAIYMSIKDISLSVVQLWSIYLKMYLLSHSFKLHCAYIFLAFCFHICQCWWQWLPSFCLLPLIVLVGSFWKCIVTVPLTLRSLHPFCGLLTLMYLFTVFTIALSFRVPNTFRESLLYIYIAATLLYWTTTTLLATASSTTISWLLLYSLP